jgi:photosystem II stability/assembly factor-like uncharacterized protein
MSSKRFLRSTLGFLFLGSGLLTSCGGGDYAILVRVTGRPSDTAALSATVKLGDQYATQGIDVVPPQSLDYVGIRLPADKSGLLTVEVSALGTDQCKAAAGTVTVDLGKGRGQEVTVNLSALSPRRCSLLISQSGSGSVSLTPTGTPCGASCYDYNQGDTVVLKFLPTGNTYGAQTYVSSGGICDGVNDCSINVSRRVQVEAKFQPRMCLSKWCWYHPLPQGQRLSAIWGTSASDIWAVGDGGVALHYDGQTWSWMSSGTKQNLNGVWTAAPGSTWMVGDAGTVLRFDGSKFVSEPSGVTGNLNSVWGAAANNLFAVGDGGTIVQRNATTWSAQTSTVTNDLYRVIGSDAQNVWAVGQGSTVLANKGSGWQKQTAPTISPLTDVWTAGPNDVWVVGGLTSADCAVGRWDGVMWKKNNPCKLGLTAIWGNSALDVWAGGSEKSISRYVEKDVSKPLTTDILSAGSLKGIIPSYTAAWGAAAGEVYYTTTDGNLIRRVASPGGTQLTAPLAAMSPNSSTASLRALTGSGLTEYVLYSDGTVYSLDGKRFTQLPNPPSGVFADAWAAPTGELFVAVDQGYVFRFANNSWTQLNLSSTSSSVLAVGGPSASDFYGGTALGYLYRFVNGVPPAGSINATAFGGAIQAIWGRSASESWAVGLSGTIVRITGSSTSTTSGATSGAGTTALYGVHGAASPNKYIWVVGAGGTVLRLDTVTTTWTKITASPAITTSLTSVVALSDSDVWISGDAGVLLHWDGTTLAQVPGPFGNRNLTELHSPSGTDLWLAGSGSAIWRYVP